VATWEASQHLLLGTGKPRKTTIHTQYNNTHSTVIHTQYNNTHTVQQYTYSTTVHKQYNTHSTTIHTQYHNTHTVQQYAHSTAIHTVQQYTSGNIKKIISKIFKNFQKKYSTSSLNFLVEKTYKLATNTRFQHLCK